MPNILLTRDLAPAPKGSAGTRIMADKEGNRYYVKFKENSQFLKVLANEYVAGKIAETLELPAPIVHIVDIDPLLVPAMAPINQLAISAGPHFGSAELPNLYTLPSIRSIVGQCHNADQYPAIILFDALLYNSDRRNDGNYVVTTSVEGLKFNIIDHGFCFGTMWDKEMLKGICGEWSNAYLPEMYSMINSRNEFDLPLQMIEVLSDDFFANLVVQIPADWLPDLTERATLVQFLIYQRNHIKEMLEANLHKFPNIV
jgi:hypothetical protein